MNSRHHFALVVLFLLVISLPLAANLAGVDGGDPGAENRDLATLADGPGRWFEDHFGFRATLVRWYGESRLFLLGVSPSTAVIKGRDGWLFYGDDGSVEDYARQEPMSPAEVGGWRETLTRANNWLHNRHIAYVFTIAPDKYTIYPDGMPSSLRRVTDTSRTDQLYEGLRGTGVVAVDVRPALLAARVRERIYRQTDTHWNDRGAFVAYQGIIGAVRAAVPAVPPAWTRNDLDPVSRDVEAMDLAGMMGLKRVLREADLQLAPRRPRLAKVVEPPGSNPTDQVGYLVTEIPGSNLPRAVIFRDSFVSQLAPFLSEHFSRAVYLWQNDFDSDMVEKEHPDVVIQEIVGRHLYNYIPSPELVPQLALSAQAGAAETVSKRGSK